MRERQLVADALNRLVETETGLDADDEQVERVGQPEADAMLPASSPCARAPCPAGRSRAGTPTSATSRFGRTMIGVAKQRERRQRDADADAEEDDERFAAAVAGGDQPLLQLAHFRWPICGATLPRRLSVSTTALP